MVIDNEKHQKIRENIKKLITNVLNSDEEFKTLLGHAYANLTSKNHKCTNKVLNKLKERYGVDLTGEVDNLRTNYINKKSEVKTNDDLKNYANNKAKTKIDS